MTIATSISALIGLLHEAWIAPGEWCIDTTWGIRARANLIEGTVEIETIPPSAPAHEQQQPTEGYLLPPDMTITMDNP